MTEFVIAGGTVVTPRRIGEANLLIREGKIAQIGKLGGQAKRVAAQGLLVLPGAIDAHVHLDLPVAGTRSADDWATGTRAAAAGGVTAVIDFTIGAPDAPLPDQVARRLDEARAAAVDFALRAEMVGWTPDRVDELAAAAELGVRSFKFYLAYASSGRRTSLGTLQRAMEAIRDLGGTAMVHAEAEELVDAAGGPFPAVRPALAEEVAIAEVGILARETRCPTYIAHISTGRGAVALRAAQRAGAPLVGETCPHYLLLDEAVYARPDGHRFSVVPPLRTAADREALWQALRRRQFQAVATDHCPFTNAEKDAHRDDPTHLPSGLPGVETLLPLLYSEGVAKGRITLRDLAWYLSEGPARAFGLWPGKGGIRPGADADLVLLDPGAKWTVRAQRLHTRTDFSPYEGMTLRGRVMGVLSRGEWLVRDGEILAPPGRGRFIPWG